MTTDELYEALEECLSRSLETHINRDVFVYLCELYHRDKLTFLPWYDYNRIFCGNCYEEIRREDRCSEAWFCMDCAETLLPLSESQAIHDTLCLRRYHELVREMLPMVREEIRQRKRVRSIHTHLDILTGTTSGSTEEDLVLPVD